MSFGEYQINVVNVLLVFSESDLRIATNLTDSWESKSRNQRYEYLFGIPPNQRRMRFWHSA